MVSHMESAQTQVFLVHILSPVYRFIEDDTIRDPHIGEFKIYTYFTSITHRPF